MAVKVSFSLVRISSMQWLCGHQLTEVAIGDGNQADRLAYRCDAGTGRPNVSGGLRRDLALVPRSTHKTPMPIATVTPIFSRVEMLTCHKIFMGSNAKTMSMTPEYTVQRRASVRTGAEHRIIAAGDG